MGKASRRKRERKGPRTLYHFTSRYHLPHILNDGFLRPTESNVSFARAAVGPGVVWLVDEPELSAPHGLSGSAVDKTAVRITVKVENAEPWTEWVKRQPDDGWSRETLVRTGGGPAAARRWWVVQGPIFRENWLDIRA